MRRMNTQPKSIDQRPRSRWIDGGMDAPLGLPGHGHVTHLSCRWEQEEGSKVSPFRFHASPFDPADVTLFTHTLGSTNVE